MCYRALSFITTRCPLRVHVLLIVAVGVLLLSQDAPALAAVSRRFAYVPNRDGGRVSMHALDDQSGQLISLGLSQDISGNEPQALAVDPLRRYVYVVNFFSETISMFAINEAAGTLSLLSTAKTGLTPQSVAAEPSGRWVFVANSTSHSVWVYEVDPTSKKLIPRWTPHAGQEPTSVAVHPFDRWVYVTDSSNNLVYTFELDLTTGQLTPEGRSKQGPILTWWRWTPPVASPMWRISPLMT
jgi:6-phosphogluconolactonase